jgi:hypothetical protein
MLLSKEKPRTHQFVRWFLLDEKIILSVLDVPLISSKGTGGNTTYHSKCSLLKGNGTQ